MTKQTEELSGLVQHERGISIGAKGATVQVDFGTAFSNVPRVTLTPHSDDFVWLVEVTATYFKWSNSSNQNDVTVDWIAIAGEA